MHPTLQDAEIGSGADYDTERIPGKKRVDPSDRALNSPPSAFAFSGASDRHKLRTGVPLLKAD